MKKYISIQDTRAKENMNSEWWTGSIFRATVSLPQMDKEMEMESIAIISFRETNR